MTSRSLRPALVLAVWTVLVWTTRIRNIWTDDGLSTAGQAGRTALALAFTVFAVATVGVWWRARSDAAPVWAGGLVKAFALWTTVVWVVRATQIAFADHGLAFVVVHTLLAVASIGLAVWATRALASEQAGRSSEPVDAP